MASKDLNDKVWKKVIEYLKSESRLYRGAEVTCRPFLFARWESHWERMIKHFNQDRDFKMMILESTIVRAHPSAAGALKKTAFRKIKP